MSRVNGLFLLLYFRSGHDRMRNRKEVMVLSGFHEMIETMKGLDYKEKVQFYQYLLGMAQQTKQKFTREDREEILAYAYQEVDNMLRDIPAASCYKEKDTIFVCEDCLLGIVMHLSGSP